MTPAINPKVTPKIAKKQEEIAHLDAATQAIIMKMNKSDFKLKVSGFIAVLILLIVGVVGIIYQNHLATQSKQHLDCIIKDLATPQKPGTMHKYIDYQSTLSSDCKIKFN